MSQSGQRLSDTIQTAKALIQALTRSHRRGLGAASVPWHERAAVEVAQAFLDLEAEHSRCQAAETPSQKTSSGTS